MQVQRHDWVCVQQPCITRRSGYPLTKRIQALQRAAVSAAHVLPSCSVVGQLAFQRGAELGNVFAPMNPLYELLRSECNKNAEDNDTDLADKDSPPVQRFG